MWPPRHFNHPTVGPSHKSQILFFPPRFVRRVFEEWRLNWPAVFKLIAMGTRVDRRGRGVGLTARQQQRRGRGVKYEQGERLAGSQVGRGVNRKERVEHWRALKILSMPPPRPPVPPSASQLILIFFYALICKSDGNK